MPAPSEKQRLREEAWIGDAVLSLFARQFVLERDQVMDAGKQARLTSNHFLSAFGEPTEVEARIGRIYQQQGLEGAFAWIRNQLLPRFEQREVKSELARNGGRVAVKPPKR
ncbi:MAG: hypothetical protein KIT83_17060 [Bryobacterales bacterium]|nr:hypothetical protein [Bryobacterales bacterium]